MDPTTFRFFLAAGGTEAGPTPPPGMWIKSADGPWTTAASANLAGGQIVLAVDGSGDVFYSSNAERSGRYGTVTRMTEAGVILWSKEYTVSDSTSYWTGITALVQPPGAGSDFLYIVCYEQASLLCVFASTGVPLWERTLRAFRTFNADVRRGSIRKVAANSAGTVLTLGGITMSDSTKSQTHFSTVVKQYSASGIVIHGRVVYNNSLSTDPNNTTYLCEPIDIQASAGGDFYVAVRGGKYRSGFTTNIGFQILRFNATAGLVWASELWGTAILGEDVRVNAININEAAGAVYVTGLHYLTGITGPYYQPVMLKYDMNTGALIWQKWFDNKSGAKTSNPFSFTPSAFFTLPDGKMFLRATFVGIGNDSEIFAVMDAEANFETIRIWKDFPLSTYPHPIGSNDFSYNNGYDGQYCNNGALNQSGTGVFSISMGYITAFGATKNYEIISKLPVNGSGTGGYTSPSYGPATLSSQYDTYYWNQFTSTAPTYEPYTGLTNISAFNSNVVSYADSNDGLEPVPNLDVVTDFVRTREVIINIS